MRTSTWWLAVGACLSIPSAAAYGDQAGASASLPKLVIGVVVDVRPDQMPVIDFERQVVNAISSAFEGLSAEGFVVAYSDRVQWITGVSTLESALRDGGRRINADSIVAPPFASVLNDSVAEGLERLASEAGAFARPSSSSAKETTARARRSSRPCSKGRRGTLSSASHCSWPLIDRRSVEFGSTGST